MAITYDSIRTGLSHDNDESRLTALETLLQGYADKHKIFNNITIPVSSWVTDNTYTKFPYKANITCNGVTQDYYCEVCFNVMEAVSGNYAPICSSSNNTITIYAVSKPNSTITIPSIKADKL